MATTRSRDGCVVPTEQLSALVGGFVADWNRRHPPTGGRFGQASQQQQTRRRRPQSQARVEVTQVGAVEWLSTATGIPAGTIQNVVNSRNRHTELRIADKLVAALERPDAWHDGTLEIVPNPNASRAAQASCCGGSSDSLLGA